MTRPISPHLSIASGRRPRGRTNRSTRRARSNRPIFVPSRKRKGPARSGGGGEPEASCLVSIGDKGLVVKELCPVATIARRARQAEEEKPSVRQLVLEGVIVSSDPSRSVALVRRPGGSHACAVNVGETIYGFELLEVSDAAITLREGKEN